MNNIIILIPHYNDIKGLKKTLLSIDEEVKIDVIIVDDGSDDEIDEAKIEFHGNVFFKFLVLNSGIETALNIGLEFALEKGYEFIGRLDCGDLCHKNRFTKQLSYLETNKDIKLLGTWARVLDEDENFKFNLKHPIDYETIKNKMYLNNVFIHPSVVFRSEIIATTGKYPLNRKAAEDYAFFFNIVKTYRSENYPEILLDYIMHSHSISKTNRKPQVYNRIKIIIDNFYFGFTPIHGLVRNLILLIMPIRVITLIKSKMYR